jgi:hypothetical protein
MYTEDFRNGDLDDLEGFESTKKLIDHDNNFTSRRENN